MEEEGAGMCCVSLKMVTLTVCCVWKTRQAPRWRRSEFVPVQAEDAARSVRRASPRCSVPPFPSAQTSATSSSLPARGRHTPSGALRATTPDLLACSPGFRRRVTSLQAVLSQGGRPSWKCQCCDTPVPARSSSPPALSLRQLFRRPSLRPPDARVLARNPLRACVIRLRSHLPELSSSVFCPCAARLAHICHRLMSGSQPLAAH